MFITWGVPMNASVKLIKFDLNLRDVKISNLKQLQDNFSADILPIFQSGRLAKWFKSRDLSEQATAIEAISKIGSELEQLKDICQVLRLDDDEEILQFILDDWKTKQAAIDILKSTQSTFEVELDVEVNVNPLDVEVNVNPLIGMVFVQRGGEGISSYHFDDIDNIYINFSKWRPAFVLDCLKKVPDRKIFIETSFDLESRTFCGTIDWYPSTFGNNAKWVYEMKFSNDYKLISSGCVKTYHASGKLSAVILFGHDLHYQASVCKQR